jgi:hypothetical protein
MGRPGIGTRRGFPLGQEKHWNEGLVNQKDG